MGSPPIVISTASLESGRIQLSGNNLNSIQNVIATSANLSGYSMEIQSQTQTSLIIKLVHQSTSALSLAIGTVLSFSVATASAQTTVNLTITAAFPSGAIVAYNGACPTGWSEFTTGKGRVLVGAGVGNNDSLGAALTNRVIASVGGLEYTTGIPASSQNSAETSPDPTFSLGVSGVAIFTDQVQDLSLSGDKANSNMPPFVVVRYCSKD